MDKVRFGRVLGKGARGAMKTAWEAVEAAAAPDPSPRPQAPPATRPVSSGPSISHQQPINLHQTASRVIEAHRVVNHKKAQMRGAVLGAGKQAGKGMLAPLRKFSSVLWMQVTGLFFAFIALILLEWAWKLRSVVSTHTWHTTNGSHFLLYTVFGLMFLYFTVSSFVRAHLRDKRR